MTTKIPNEAIDRNNARILKTFKAQERFTPEADQYKKQQGTEPFTKSTRKGVVQSQETSSKVKEFLMAVNLYQYKKTLTEIYKIAGFSAGTGSRLAKGCERKNFIKVIKASFGRGCPRYPVLTPEGYEALGIEVKNFYGKGAGFEHVLYQHLIADHFSEFKPVIELNRGSKFIDVAVETNNKLTAIEVAMTLVHEKENIEKDFNLAQASSVIVACKDKKVLNKVQEIIAQLPKPMAHNTQAILIAELLSIKPEQERV